MSRNSPPQGDRATRLLDYQLLARSFITPYRSLSLFRLPVLIPPFRCGISESKSSHPLFFSYKNDHAYQQSRRAPKWEIFPPKIRELAHFFNYPMILFVCTLYLCEFWQLLEVKFSIISMLNNCPIF